jgi:hypothetical protein
MTRRDFSKAFSVPGFLISSTNLDPKFLTPLGISEGVTISKAPFSSRPLISFCLDSTKDVGVFLGVTVLATFSSCTSTEMSAVY